MLSYPCHTTASQRDLGGNLKKKGIKLKFSGKVHFYLSNNILKFHRNTNGGTPLFWPLKSRDLFPNHRKFSFDKLNNHIYHLIDLLTLNKKYYYNFF